MQRGVWKTLALAAVMAPALGAGQSPAPKQGGTAIWLLDTTQIIVENGCADAVPKLTAVIRNRPDDAMALNARGNCYRQANDYSGALADYHAALRLKPNQVTAWIAVGIAYEDLKAWDQALATYQRARVVDPWNARAAEGVGASLHHLNRDAEALAALNEAIKLGPNFRVFAYRGATFNRLRRYPEAEADLKRAFQLEPKRMISLIALADVYAKQGRHRERVAVLEQALRIEPQNQGTARQLSAARLALASGGSSPPRVAGHAGVASATAPVATASSRTPGVSGRAPVAAVSVARLPRLLTLDEDRSGYRCPDGDEVVIARCAGPHDSADCQILLTHLPRRNNVQVFDIDTRGALSSRLAACTVTRVTIDSQGFAVLPP